MEKMEFGRIDTTFDTTYDKDKEGISRAEMYRGGGETSRLIDFAGEAVQAMTPRSNTSELTLNEESSLKRALSKVKGKIGEGIFDRNYGTGEGMFPRYLEIGIMRLKPRIKRDMLFSLPHDFKDAAFEDFELIDDGHKTAWNLLFNYGLDPKRGLYLWGGYGTGKTHLICAFARGLLAEASSQYLNRIEDFLDGTIKEYLAGNILPKKAESFEQEMENQGTFSNKLGNIIDNQLKLAKQKYPHQLTDLAFATFDILYDARNNGEGITDFLSRRIVMIDDIHPKGELDRMNFIQQIIEFRYNEMRAGKMFVTSNLPMNELLSPQQSQATRDYPKEISERVNSRLAQMCMPIEFKSQDYRIKIAEKENVEMEKLAIELEEKRKENKK